MKTAELFEVLQKLVEGAKPGPQLEAQVSVVITDPDPAQWQIEVRNGAVLLNQGAPVDSDITITASSDTALKLYNKQLKPLMAIMTGKVKIKGDPTKIAVFKSLLSKKG